MASVKLGEDEDSLGIFQTLDFSKIPKSIVRTRSAQRWVANLKGSKDEKYTLRWDPIEATPELRELVRILAGVIEFADTLLSKWDLLSVCDARY